MIQVLAVLEDILVPKGLQAPKAHKAHLVAPSPLPGTAAAFMASIGENIV